MKLSYKDILTIKTLYRQGEPVFNLVNKFKVDLKTIIHIGKGGKAVVYDFNGNKLFTGYEIECEEYCEKNPDSWGSVLKTYLD